MLSPLLSGPANVWPVKVKLPQGWIFLHDANRRQKRKTAAIKPGDLRTLARADGRAFMGREITQTTLSGRSAFGQRKIPGTDSKHQTRASAIISAICFGWTDVICSS